MVLPFMKVAVSQLFSKPSCEMYPFVPKEAAPHYRGRIAYDADKCIGCGLCTRVCDGEAITIVKEPVENGEKITLEGGKLQVPANPIIPFIEGDGTGPDITRAAMTVWNAAVKAAYGVLSARRGQA